VTGRLVLQVKASPHGGAKGSPFKKGAPPFGEDDEELVDGPGAVAVDAAEPDLDPVEDELGPDEPDAPPAGGEPGLDEPDLGLGEPDLDEPDADLTDPDADVPFEDAAVPGDDTGEQAQGVAEQEWAGDLYEDGDETDPAGAYASFGDEGAAQAWLDRADDGTLTGWVRDPAGEVYRYSDADAWAVDVDQSPGMTRSDGPPAPAPAAAPGDPATDPTRNLFGE